MAAPDPTDGSTSVNPRVMVVALGGFWSSFVALNTARAMVLGQAHQNEAIVRRIVVAGIGMGLAWLMYRLLRWIRPSSLALKICVTAIVSLVAACPFATANYLIFDVISPLSGHKCLSWGAPCTLHDAIASISDLMLSWSFVFAAWGMLYLSLASAEQARAADQRAMAHRDAARLAEIRALRYQINPHFLFNLLNTLSTLVLKRQLEEAEALIGEIGRFFRYSLAADPVADSMLADEIEMQAQYLDLERRRFPNRLATSFDIADGVTTALVPSLILQPLVENAIKHGLGRTSATVTISIRAFKARDDQLSIIVEDDAQAAIDSIGPGDGSSTAGLGLGLKNVADRLRARYGARTSCVAGPRVTGGHQVQLIMPLILA